MTSHPLHGMADWRNAQGHRKSTAAIAETDLLQNLLQAATTEIRCVAEGLNTPCNK